MNGVVAKEGQESDKNVWAGLSEKGKPRYSLTARKMFTAGLDMKMKSTGALAWTQGMQQVDESLIEKNSVDGETWDQQIRREALYQEMGKAVDHDNAGAEEDLEQLVGGMDWLIAGL